MKSPIKNVELNGNAIIIVTMRSINSCNFKFGRVGLTAVAKPLCVIACALLSYYCSFLLVFPVTFKVSYCNNY